MQRWCALVVVLCACGKVVAEQPDAPPGDDAPPIDAPVDMVDAHIPVGAFVLTGTPDPAIVFNTIDQTYRLPNNLVNSVWHRQTNKLITGDFSIAKYYSFAEATNPLPTSPVNGTTIHTHLVHAAATNRVLSSTQSGTAGSPASTFVVGSVDASGLLQNEMPVVWSDGFTGNCALTSSSATELFCFDGTVIRRYTTELNSATLTANGTIPLTVALPAAAIGTSFGGTFAFDGAFFYFAHDATSSSDSMYIVYSVNGTFVNTFTSTAGSINATYFDWSIGRYAVHDGFAGRSGGSVFSIPTPGQPDDTQAYSPVSPNHTLDD